LESKGLSPGLRDGDVLFVCLAPETRIPLLVRVLAAALLAKPDHGCGVSQTFRPRE